MSDLRELLENAGELAEQLITEMFEVGADDNEILLGEFLSGSTSIQVQLKVTSNPAQFMDDCS